MSAAINSFNPKWNVRFGLIFHFLEVVEFLCVIGFYVVPTVVGPCVGMDRQARLVLVAEDFDEDVLATAILSAGAGFGPFAAVEYELEVACHGEDAVVAPFLFGKGVEVEDVTVGVIQFEETGERHDHCVVTITQCRSAVVEHEAGVRFADDFGEEVAL